MITPRDIEPIRDGRYAIHGIVCVLSTTKTELQGIGYAAIEGREIHIECTRCTQRWSERVDANELRKIYVRIPTECSPYTLIQRAAVGKFMIIDVAHHVCTPPGFELHMPPVILDRVAKGAPRHEQLEAFATAVLDLAKEAGA